MEQRQTWSSRLTYILTVAGATIDSAQLGASLSRWSERRRCLRPDVHFGDAFVGIPIILVENVIGRRGQANSIDAFLPEGSKYSPLWKFFGYTGILGAFGILSYYMPLGGWVITYIYHLILGLFWHRGRS